MSKLLDYTGLGRFLDKLKTLFVTGLGTSGNSITYTKNGVTSNITVPYAEKTVSIPFGYLDYLNSTSTAFIATVDGINELRNGVCFILLNDSIRSASGCTLNVNNLGAKRLFTTAWDNVTTEFYKRTYLFVYDESLDNNNGGWLLGQIKDTTYNLLTDSSFKSGASNATVLVTAKILADNLYIGNDGSINIRGKSITPIVESQVDSYVSDSTNLVQSKAIRQYIISRGENLCTNGFASLGNNYNFGNDGANSLQFDGSDTDGAGGCFKRTTSTQSSNNTQELMPVDISKSYMLRYSVKNTEETWTYDYISMFDIDGNAIAAGNVNFVQGSTTTLAQDLNNGDTVVHFTDLSGWDDTSTSRYFRGFIFWNYVNSFGYQYPIEYYSRNDWFELWDDSSLAINKVNNTITLKSVWNHGTFTAGTPVSQHGTSGSNVYGNSAYIATPNQWVRKSFLFTPEKFRNGTAFISLGWLHNYSNVTNNTFKLSSVSFTLNLSFDALNAKQDIINDLNTIRSGASAGATAYQKPSGGIPSTDLASTVLTSLGKADIALPNTTKYAGSQSVGGAADKTESIFIGTIDTSTSTSAAYVATVNGLTRLIEGTCIFLKINTASAYAPTLKVNDFDAKPIYTSLTSVVVSGNTLRSNSFYFFVYTETIGSGAWVMSAGYDSNDTAQFMTHYQGQMKSVEASSGKMLMLTYSDTELLPVYSGTQTQDTTKTLTTESFIPYGNIFWLPGTINKNSNINFSAMWQQYYIDLSYSFNTGTSLTSRKSVYMVCVPQANGRVKLAASPITQDLPTTEDGYVYIYLGVAWSTTNITLFLNHPIYYFKDGAIRLWTNAEDISGKENSANKVTSLSSSSTDIQYPSAKCVYDAINNVNPRIPITSHGTSNTTFALTPNIYHKWGSVASLTLTLATPDNVSVVNEYIFSFTSPATPTTLSVPASINWVTPLDIEPNKLYRVSIIDNLATWITSDMVVPIGDVNTPEFATKAYVDAGLALKEDSSNKVTSVDENSTNTQYPSAKAMYDALNSE